MRWSPLARGGRALELLPPPGPTPYNDEPCREPPHEALGPLLAPGVGARAGRLRRARPAPASAGRPGRGPGLGEHPRGSGQSPRPAAGGPLVGHRPGAGLPAPRGRRLESEPVLRGGSRGPLRPVRAAPALSGRRGPGGPARHPARVDRGRRARAALVRRRATAQPPAALADGGGRWLAEAVPEKTPRVDERHPARLGPEHDA